MADRPRAEGPHVRFSYEEARGVLERDDVEAMRAVAADHQVQPEILYFLAEQDDAEVRRLVAGNPATPTHADEILTGDRAEPVRVALAQKMARRLEALDGDPAARQLETIQAIITRLARDQASAVRRVIAEELAACALLPRPVAFELARDVDDNVCCPMLERSPLLVDDDLIAMIGNHLSSAALTAIAGRKALGEELSGCLAGTRDVAAVAALLGNPNAQIREEVLDQIIDEAPEHESWHAPLAHRPGISESAILRIASFIAADLLADLSARTDLSEETMASLAERVEERLGDLDAQNDERDMVLDAVESDVAARHKAGELDAEFIGEAARSKNHAVVWAALGLLSGAGTHIARQIFASRSAKAVAALTWIAGLPAALAVTLQTNAAGVAAGDAIAPDDDGGYALSEDEMRWQLDLFDFSPDEPHDQQGEEMSERDGEPHDPQDEQVSERSEKTADVG